MIHTNIRQYIRVYSRQMIFFFYIVFYTIICPDLNITRIGLGPQDASCPSLQFTIRHEEIYGLFFFLILEPSLHQLVFHQKISALNV